MRYFLILFSFLILSCENNPHHPNHGSYRAVLQIGDALEIPFTANFLENHSFEFYNSDEIVSTEETEIRGDSIIIRHPVFEGTFKGRFTATEIEGVFVKESLDRVVPFKMIHGESVRFKTEIPPTADVSGNWETVFSPDNEVDRYPAKGVFKQNGSEVKGTFRTTTGDYRYLEGVMEGDSLKLSTFDMAHAFLFFAEVRDSTMTGMFYSGSHFTEPFKATKNENYELPDPHELTLLKPGFDKLEFSFPDTEGNIVSIADERFRNKVVVVQIMGSWCPNCLDESRFLSNYYELNNFRDLEIIALAFEYKPTEKKALEGLQKLKESLGIDYTVLLAQYGSEDKELAVQKLPMLNHIISYPTTIFVDKTGVVRKIYTGFNGPATGDKHEEFKDEFNDMVKELLAESFN